MKTLMLVLRKIIAICVLTLVATSIIKGQSSESKNGLNIGFSTFTTSTQQFKYDYPFRFDAYPYSKGAYGYEGKLEYYRQIAPKFEASLGIIVGVYPIDFGLHLDKEFSPTGKSYDFYYASKSNARYYGLTLNFGYNVPLGNKQKLSFLAGINYVFFTPQFYNISGHVTTDTMRFTMFESKSNVNPTDKIFIAPELSTRYQYKLGKHFAPYIGVSVVISKNKPIIGHHYSIYGKNETLEGTFTKRFIHAAAEVGVRYAFAKK